MISKRKSFVKMLKGGNKCYVRFILILAAITVLLSYGFSVLANQDKNDFLSRIFIEEKHEKHNEPLRMKHNNFGKSSAESKFQKTKRESDSGADDLGNLMDAIKEQEGLGDSVVTNKDQVADEGDNADEENEGKPHKHKHRNKDIAFRAIQKGPQDDSDEPESLLLGRDADSIREDAGLAVVETVVVGIDRNLEFDAMTEEKNPEGGKPKQSGFTQPDLLINDASNDYPTFSYHGFFAPKKWHLIPPKHFNVDPDQGTQAVSNLLQTEAEKRKTMKGKSFLRLKLEKNKNSHCTDMNPAPIDIITKNAKEMVSFTDFTVHKYDTKYKFVMFIPEDGTDLLVVKLVDTSDAFPTITKGSVIGRELTFDSILIRYGADHTKGSEHFIDGKQFGMELQFLFKTSVPARTEFWNLGDAVNYFTNDNDTDNDPQIKKHFLILSVLVKVQNDDEILLDQENNAGMIYLSQAARKFWETANQDKKRGFKSRSAVLSMKQFFDVPFKDLYYTYDGTLSFPPCLNFFRWSVFAKPIVTDYKTWESFQFIPSEFSDTEFMADNFRPLDSIFINMSQIEQEKIVQELTPYLDPAVKEKISFSVLKSRPLSDKDKKDDYDYYEEDDRTGKRRASGRFKNMATSLVGLKTFNNFLFLLAMIWIASFVVVSSE